MSKIYKCDICGTPYDPARFKQETGYVDIGVKDFNGYVSHRKVRDVCPECYQSIRDFIDSRMKEEEEKETT